MNENKFPPLPKPKFTETIRGVPCITVTEHEHLMRAYALQARAQVQSKSYEEWACDALDERPFPSIKSSPPQQAEVSDAQINAVYLAWCKTSGTPESFARAILALQKNNFSHEQVPMTPEQRHEIICRYDEGKTYSDLVGIILATEAHHGITAQVKKGQV